MNTHRIFSHLLSVSVMTFMLTGCSFLFPFSDDADIAVQDTGTAVTPDDEVAEVAPLTPETMSPKIHAGATDELAPQVVVVQFGRNVAASEQGRKKASESTRLRIVPAVSGSLVWSTKSTLTFKPDVGFLPGTDYTVELMSVNTSGGVMEAPGEGWALKFKTPELGLIRLVARGPLLAALVPGGDGEAP